MTSNSFHPSLLSPEGGSSSLLILWSVGLGALLGGSWAAAYGRLGTVQGYTTCPDRL